MAFTSLLGTSDSNLLGSTLVAGAGAGEDPLEQSVTSVLSFSQNVFDGVPVVVESAITFNDGASASILFDPFTKNPSSNLGLSSEATTGTFPEIEQDLGISQSVQVVNFGPIVQVLSLAQAATPAGPIPVSVDSTLSLAGAVALERGIPQAVTSTLTLEQLAADVLLAELNLTQSVIAFVNASSIFTQDLGLTHSIQNTANFGINIEHDEVVTQSVAIEIDDGTNCPQNEWNVYGTLGNLPFIETEGNAKMTVAALDGTGDVISLRNPELDDRDRLGSTRINREGRGGELHVYRDPTWPQVNTLQGTIIGLKVEEKDAWKQFIKDHLGQEISLNDWHGRYWRVVLMNPDEAMVEDTPNRWTIAFEFEGYELDGPDVQSSLAMSGVVSVEQNLTRDVTSTLSLVSVGIRDETVLHNGDDVLYQGAATSYSG